MMLDNKQKSSHVAMMPPIKKSYKLLNGKIVMIRAKRLCCEALFQLSNKDSKMRPLFREVDHSQGNLAMNDLA